METVIHDDYASPDSIPHPGHGWTRFVCISDTHSRFQELPYGNVLIHAGDLSSWGYPHQVKKVFDWIQQQAHPVKLVVAGNHDLSLDPSIPASVFEQETPESLQSIREYVRGAEMKDAGIFYLEHEAVHFEAGGRTWKAYGSPAAPHYARGAFQYDDEETAMEIYDKIPLDTDILLTHTPPHGILDLTKKGKNAGCRYLEGRLGSLEACKLHVFGHIHEAFGAALVEVEGRSLVAVNAAQSSRGSRPIIVDIRFYPLEMLVELNKTTYASRVKRIYEAWNNASKNEDYSSIADVDALFLVAGDPASEDEPMRKGTCFQQWLLGYEFPSTFFLFQKDRIAVLCSASKSKILSQIQNVPGIPALEIYAQAKGKDSANDALPNFLSLYKSAKRAGSLLKETHTGKLISEWQKLVAESDPKPEVVEIGPAVSSLMAVKDADELKLVQTAATLTSTLLKHHVAPKLESILDRESKISHEMLSVQIEARLGSGEGDNAKGPDMKVWGKAKGLDNIDWQSAEFCYPPIIISKSSKTGYDLRYTIDSTEDNIAHKGVLLVSFGLRYKSYSTNIGRTFIVDPNPAQEAQYNLLLSLQSELLSFMKEGVQAREVYQHAISFIKEKKPELEKHFVKTVGFGMGMEFRDATYVLSPKNSHVLKANMTFNLGLGFSDLTDSNGQKYALHLVDTVRIDTNKAVLLTDGVKHSKETLFFLDSASGEDDVKAKKPPARPKANGSPSKAKTVAGKVLRNPRRAAQDDVHQTASARLMEHQKEIHQRLQEDGIARFSDGGGGIAGKEGKSWKKFNSYKGEGALPDEVEKLRIFVDRKAQTVILPIHGFAVPFHINTIKNASKNDEGDFTYLRINFQTPGQLAGKKEDTPFEDPDATFIRSVSYRSPDGHRFDSLVKQITDLKKEANKREQQKKEMADVIEQGTLIELKGRRPYKMQEAFIRPALDGKRLPGEVEIHQNGVRYQSVGNQRVDVLFSNVKHLFFQPCDHELLVVVHMHLKAPIMIGKKKTFDVQFFREATDVQFDETGNRKRKHRYGDEDEIEMEQQERKRRAMLNKEVKAFAEKVAEAASNSLGETLELDIPFRELSFEGVPFRTSVRLQPTTECLVHLTDTPFLVITLADIEIASLERVQYGLKQFDLVLIFKDFTKAPHHINSISSTQMDDVKNWLDSVDIPMSERPVNLNWGPLMKHINENPFEFFREGGWAFLGGAAGADDSQSSSSGEESEFEVDGEDFVSESSSDDDSDFGDGSGSDETGSDFGDGSESEGEDWDELERKAAKADLKRNEGRRDESEDDDRPKKKKSAPKGASKAAPKGKANGAKGKR